MFRMIDFDGKFEGHETLPKGLTKDNARWMLSVMLRQNTADKILHEAQRQGRISFYMTSYNEEAAQVGSAAGLKPQDMIYAQYREPAVLQYRGYKIEQMIAQCVGSVEDTARGRQMPMHFGSPELNYQTISSPLGTQIPQATGAGYGYRLEAGDRVCMCYFGEGAASEGDFHAGLNMAATLKARTIFFCRNNGYAISTPAKDQYAGDGIVARGVGYGIPSVRVDGNDAVAVMFATEKARELCVSENTPILIEAMTYRGGHHSTSDDSTRYREKRELETNTTIGNAIDRFTAFLTQRQWWTADESNAVRVATRKEVLEALSRQEKLDKHPIGIMLEDVYDVMPPSLQRQKAELDAHVRAHPELLRTH